MSLTLHLTADDTIIISYPDGQEIAIPGNEPQRLLAVLRTERDREATRTNSAEKLLKFRREFQAAFTPAEVKDAGAAVRKKHEDELQRTALRKEREKRLRLKRVEKRDRLQAANELLAIVGL